MTCRLTERDELHAFADGELAEAEERRWEEHVQVCAQCRTELAQMRSLRAAIRAELPPCEPPRALREDIRRAVRAEQAERRAARPSRTRWLALAASAVLAAGVGSWELGRASAERDTIATDVVAGHLRSLELDHLVDIESSEHHVVKPWFAGKL